MMQALQTSIAVVPNGRSCWWIAAIDASRLPITMTPLRRSFGGARKDSVVDNDQATRAAKLHFVTEARNEISINAVVELRPPAYVVSARFKVKTHSATSSSQ
ncbi:hypothetical protein AOQ73_21230 [Bradyrhizobium pachyrhizi]|nr:hypothetical protein AOQ73_21230 [Bradyrhizobium pachyrhizi]